MRRLSVYARFLRPWQTSISSLVGFGGVILTLAVQGCISRSNEEQRRLMESNGLRSVALMEIVSTRINFCRIASAVSSLTETPYVTLVMDDEATNFIRARISTLSFLEMGALSRLFQYRSYALNVMQTAGLVRERQPTAIKLAVPDVERAYVLGVARTVIALSRYAQDLMAVRVDHRIFEGQLEQIVSQRFEKYDNVTDRLVADLRVRYPGSTVSPDAFVPLSTDPCR